jgi:hypothetical protein
MAKDDWRIKGGRRKGKKALKYADLLWGDEKERRITLEDLCRCWNLARLPAKNKDTNFHTPNR